MKRHGKEVASHDQRAAAAPANAAASLDLTTEVELVSFDARAREPAHGNSRRDLDQAVELHWETGSELNNLGFTSIGPYPKLVPTSGSRPPPFLGSAPHRWARSTATATPVLRTMSRTSTSWKTSRPRGRPALHGPVSATPNAHASPDSKGGASTGDRDTSPALITYGDPTSNSLRVLQRGRRYAVVELHTNGFYAEPQEDGSVRLEVPGFDSLTELAGPRMPVKRTWVEAVAGRKVKLLSVQARGVEAFTSLRPSGAEVPEIVATPEGTVRARRRARKAFRGEGLYPSTPARVVSVGFQGDVKKALMELAPLRWDESRGQLLLARRLVVRLSFREREPTERILADGVRGRRYSRQRSHDRRTVVARLGTAEERSSQRSL